MLLAKPYHNICTGPSMTRLVLRLQTTIPWAGATSCQGQTLCYEQKLYVQNAAFLQIQLTSVYCNLPSSNLRF